MSGDTVDTDSWDFLLMSTELLHTLSASTDESGNVDKPPQMVTVIKPETGWVRLNVREIWRYRGLLLQLVWRDFSAKYRQSVIGVGWAVINPLVQMALYTLVFGRMARLPSEGSPYPVFVFAGLLPWMYFSGCLSGVSSSTVNSSNLLTKIYFPRLILPLSRLANGLIDFGIQFVMLGVMMAWYGVTPSWAILTIPLFLCLCMVSAASIGLWAAALSVKYRDVNQLTSVMARMWMWLTPVAYSIDLVPESWRTVYRLNPMVGAIEGFRWALLGKVQPDWEMVAFSTAIAGCLLTGGLYFFRRTEGTFADVI